LYQIARPFPVLLYEPDAEAGLTDAARSQSLIMAAAYPKSTFHGFDVHEGSIGKAREHAAAEGLANARGKK